jgi:hypothetical protein
MQTYTGRMFWPMDPRPEDICIEDIAHSLAHQCRFAGHTKTFYSVAQHSVLVSDVVPPEDAAWGLLHDASEAYLVDLPRPIKKSGALGAEYKRVEDLVMQAVVERFNLSPYMPASVKQADDVLVVTEGRDLLGPQARPWRIAAEPLPQRIVGWGPSTAKQSFPMAAERLGLR